MKGGGDPVRGSGSISRAAIEETRAGRTGPTRVGLRLRRALVPLVMVLVSGCSTDANVVMANRTTDTIAFSPGAIRAPCSSTAFTIDELVASGAEALADPLNRDWVPDGAVPYSGPPLALGNEVSGPVTFVFTSNGVNWHLRRVPPDELPECAGRAPDGDWTIKG